MRLLLMGAPGAGKGTQAARVAEALGVPAISTGDIFREHLGGDTPLGREVRRYVEAGEYVPDEVTNAMVRARLADADCLPGFLLDGYPRTLDQVAELDTILAERGESLDAVVHLRVEPETLVRRLLARAATEGRSDDTEPVIRRRMEVFTAETAPLTQEYAVRGLVHEVDGGAAVDLVTEQVLGALRPALA